MGKGTTPQPKSWGFLLSVQSITPVFFRQWGPKDRHRDLAGGNRKPNLIVLCLTCSPEHPLLSLLCPENRHGQHSWFLGTHWQHLEAT